MTSLSLSLHLAGSLGNIESFPVWIHSTRPPDKGRGWVGKVPLVKDLGFETIDEKLMRGGAHPLCDRSGPLVILGLAFSRNGLRTKYPASVPSLFLSLSPQGVFRTSISTSPPLFGKLVVDGPNGIPARVCTATVPRPMSVQPWMTCTAYLSQCWGVCGLYPSAGPRAQARLPPASPPACLLPITLRRRGLIVRPHQTKSNASARKRGQQGSRDSCSAASWQQ